MLNLGRVFLIFMLSIGFTFSASVKATVDTVEVVKGNPVTLRIKATGGSAAFPKILMVGSAPVTSRRTSSSRNISMSNGSVTNELITTKMIQFMPEEDMTIPSYTVNISGKKYTTDPIDIKVVKSNAPSSKNGSLFTIQMRANKEKVHVGESFMVTVYFALRNDVRLSQEVQYNQPGFSDFSVTQGAEQQAYIKDGYQVQEIRYIVTAQKEGNVTISPAEVKVGVPDGSKRDIFGMAFGTKWYQSASNTLNIHVLPQTQESDLIGEYSVQATLDATEVKSNKPVNLTVNIEGKGNLESFEFPKYEIDGVTVYSDEAEIETKIVDGELHSSYVKSFAFISDVDFTIPQRTFSMLNTNSDTMKELIVESFDISIKKSAVTRGPSVNNVNQGVVQTYLTQEKKPEEIVVEKEVEVQIVAWWMLVISFLLGALMMYGLKFLPKGNTKLYKQSEALKILYGHMSDDSKVEEMVRKLYAKKNGDKSVVIDKKELKEMVERYK